MNWQWLPALSWGGGLLRLIDLKFQFLLEKDKTPCIVPSILYHPHWISWASKTYIFDRFRTQFVLSSVHSKWIVHFGWNWWFQKTDSHYEYQKIDRVDKILDENVILQRIKQCWHERNKTILKQKELCKFECVPCNSDLQAQQSVVDDGCLTIGNTLSLFQRPCIGCANRAIGKIY